MRILIANDDGIDAAGLRALVRVFSEAGHEITVVAPDGQRSAKSHSITVGSPISVRPAEVPGACRAWTIGGMPADCVKLALRTLAPETEFVLSGINHGFNIGTDVLYSGTVGAAMEAVLDNRPALAVSLGAKSKDYDRAARIGLSVFNMLQASPLPRFCIANLNIPETEEICGLRAVPLCPLWYDDEYKYERDADGTEYYTLCGEFSKSIPHGEDDYHMILRGYATLTIMCYDMAEHEETKKRAEACSSLRLA